MHLRNCRPVICDRDALAEAGCQTGLHFPLVEHTPAAVDDERNAGEILRKLRTGGKPQIQRFAGITRQPAGQLFSPDVAALPVVRAALGNQHRVAVGKRIQRRSTVNDCFEIALVTGKQNRELREQNVRRHIPADTLKRLRVRHHQLGLLGE